MTPRLADRLQRDLHRGERKHEWQRDGFAVRLLCVREGCGWRWYPHQREPLGCRGADPCQPTADPEAAPRSQQPPPRRQRQQQAPQPQGATQEGRQLP